MTLCFAFIGVAIQLCGRNSSSEKMITAYAAEEGGETVVETPPATEEGANPEEGKEEPSAPTPETYPCKVVVDNIQYGDIIVDKTEGNVGDVVTVYAKPYSLFGLKTLSVNGTALVANEDGNFTFAMVEGENLVSAVFEVNQNEIKYILGLVENVKDGNIKDLFTVKNLFTLISWAISLFMGSGFCVTLLKSKKIKAETAAEMSAAVETATKSEVAKGIGSFLGEKFEPSFNALSDSISEISKMCQTMARCMVLSQENTPEARLAIIQELSANSQKAESLAEEVRKIVHAEMELTEQAKQEKLDMIKELEDKNNAIGTEPETVETVTETPEARLAIIQELSANSQKAESLAEEVRKIVHAEMELTEQAKQEKLDMIKELEDKNNAIGTEPETVGTEPETVETVTETPAADIDGRY